jgi:hypothetical protein
LLWCCRWLRDFWFGRSRHVDAVCEDTIAQWRRCWFGLLLLLLLFCDRIVCLLRWRLRRFGRVKQERQRVGFGSKLS